MGQKVFVTLVRSHFLHDRRMLLYNLLNLVVHIFLCVGRLSIFEIKKERRRELLFASKDTSHSLVCYVWDGELLLLDELKILSVSRDCTVCSYLQSTHDMVCACCKAPHALFIVSTKYFATIPFYRNPLYLIMSYCFYKFKQHPFFIYSCSRKNLVLKQPGGKITDEH